MAIAEILPTLRGLLVNAINRLVMCLIDCGRCYTAPGDVDVLFGFFGIARRSYALRCKSRRVASTARRGAKLAHAANYGQAGLY
jgi:hypothetical protein